MELEFRLPNGRRISPFFVIRNPDYLTFGDTDSITYPFVEQHLRVPSHVVYGGTIITVVVCVICIVIGLVVALTNSVFIGFLAVFVIHLFGCSLALDF